MVKSNVSCFEAHEKEEVSCKDTNCKNWINCETGLNCVLIAAKSGPKTLQEIGEIFDLTRMRICQIEKSVLGKLKTSLPD